MPAWRQPLRMALYLLKVAQRRLSISHGRSCASLLYPTTDQSMANL